MLSTFPNMPSTFQTCLQLSKDAFNFRKKLSTFHTCLQLSKHAFNLRWKPRGVANRRAGLHWVMNNADSGVVYFADDDNTYDVRLFKEILATKKISMFPVGFIGQDLINF